MMASEQDTPKKRSPLDALADAADALEPISEDGTSGPAAPAAQQEPVETLDEKNTRALCVMVALLREATAQPIVLNPPLRTLALHLGDDKLPKLLDPWGRVLTHYGVDLMGLMPDANHPLLLAVMATGPALWTMGKALAQELSDRAKLVRDVTPRGDSINAADSQDPGRGE